MYLMKEILTNLFSIRLYFTTIYNEKTFGPEVHETNSANIGGVSMFNQGIDLIIRM